MTHPFHEDFSGYSWEQDRASLSNATVSLRVSHAESVTSLWAKVAMTVSFLFLYLWYLFMGP